MGCVVGVALSTAPPASFNVISLFSLRLFSTAFTMSTPSGTNTVPLVPATASIAA